MANTVSAAIVARRGSRVLPIEQIKELLDNPEAYDNLIAAIDGRAAEFKAAEQAAAAAVALQIKEKNALEAEAARIKELQADFENAREEYEKDLGGKHEALARRAAEVVEKEAAAESMAAEGRRILADKQREAAGVDKEIAQRRGEVAVAEQAVLVREKSLASLEAEARRVVTSMKMVWTMLQEQWPVMMTQVARLANIDETFTREESEDDEEIPAS